MFGGFRVYGLMLGSGCTAVLADATVAYVMPLFRAILLAFERHKKVES